VRDEREKGEFYWEAEIKGLGAGLGRVRQGRQEKRRLCSTGPRPMPCLRAAMCELPARAPAACAHAVCWQVRDDGREPSGKPARTGGLAARPVLAGVNGNFGCF